MFLTGIFLGANLCVFAEDGFYMELFGLFLLSLFHQEPKYLEVLELLLNSMARLFLAGIWNSLTPRVD